MKARSKQGAILGATAHSVVCDPRWASVISRDRAADNAFVYGVKTTGVYCRPSSPSRLPKPENVVFFDSAEAAEAAGYRPSRRGATDLSSVAARRAALVAQACRQIESAESPPQLDSLARDAGMSSYHFHRVFKSVTGVTPRSYAVAHRTKKIRDRLVDRSSVTEAIYDAGFNSNSRFYDASNDVLGMTPSTFKAGGTNVDIHFAIGECSLGSILVAQSSRGICAILMGNDPSILLRDLQDQFPSANLLGADAAYEGVVATVIGTIEAPSIGLGLPLDVRGTAFQQRVWQASRGIPPGTTASYADIATQIGSPKAVRAVAQACAANSIAVAIPCHRVVRSDGSLSGYRWGVERKRELLRREEDASCEGSPDISKLGAG